MDRITRLQHKHRLRKDLIREVRKTPGPLGDALRDAVFGPLAGTAETLLALRNELQAPENRNHVASILRLAERVLHSRTRLAAGVRRKVADTLNAFVRDRLEHGEPVLAADVYSMLLRCFVRNRTQKERAIQDLIGRLRDDEKERERFVTVLWLRGGEVCQLLDDRIAEELVSINRRAAGALSPDDAEVADAAQDGILAIFKNGIFMPVRYSVVSTRHALRGHRRKEARRRKAREARAEQLSPRPEPSPEESLMAFEQMLERIKYIELIDPALARRLYQDLLALHEVDRLGDADNRDNDEQDRKDGEASAG